VISYEKSLRDQRVDSHVSTANFAYNPVNEDFTDDALPISLSTKGWDLTQGQSKRSRKKKLVTPTVLDTLKKKTKRAYNKRRNATANTLNTDVTATGSVTDGTNVCDVIRFVHLARSYCFGCFGNKVFSYFLLGPAESCKRGMAVNVNWCSRNFRLWSNPRWQDITFFVFVFSLLFQELVEFTYTN